MVIPIFIIGLISSIITELLKLFPALNLTKERRQAVGFLVAFILSLGYLATLDGATAQGIIGLIVGALASSFAIYKSLVSPMRGFAVRALKKVPPTRP